MLSKFNMYYVLLCIIYIYIFIHNFYVYIYIVNNGLEVFWLVDTAKVLKKKHVYNYMFMFQYPLRCVSWLFIICLLIGPGCCKNILSFRFPLKIYSHFLRKTPSTFHISQQTSQLFIWRLQWSVGRSAFLLCPKSLPPKNGRQLNFQGTISPRRPSIFSSLQTSVKNWSNDFSGG